MSTRATIAISDEKDTFYIYKHGDADPELMKPAIKKASKFAWKLPRFEASEFATALIKVLKKSP